VANGILRAGQCYFQQIFLNFWLLGRLTMTETASNMTGQLISDRPEWRNWYTHQTQNLARFTPHESSSLSSGTKVQTKNNFRGLA
jgi:hypothetical protein